MKTQISAEMQSRHFSRKYIYDRFKKFLDDDFKIADAKRIRSIVTTRSDMQKAVALDPVDCAFGQSCQRQGIPALIYRSVAYVVKSRKLVEKFAIDRNARLTILANDMWTGIDRSKLPALAGSTLTLRPPTGTNRVGRASHSERSRSGKRVSKEVVAARMETRNSLKSWERSFGL